MARRRIGQELVALLDWSEIDRHLVGISGAAKGELGWPPLALFRGLLLATPHNLSDIKLAEALGDRAGFCALAAAGPCRSGPARLIGEPLPRRRGWTRLGAPVP